MRRRACRCATSRTHRTSGGKAGAAGRDTRGMIRVHQFNKVEQFAITQPESSWEEHERLLGDRGGDRPGDLGVPLSRRRTSPPGTSALGVRRRLRDVEGWFPSQERYRELTSTSNTTDFQARRLGIRYRAGKSLEPVHTLNGTGGDRSRRARHPRELPGRRAGRAAGVRRAGARVATRRLLTRLANCFPGRAAIVRRMDDDADPSRGEIELAYYSMCADIAAAVDRIEILHQGGADERWR